MWIASTKKKTPRYENIFMKLNTAKFGNSNAFNGPFLDRKHMYFLYVCVKLVPGK